MPADVHFIAQHAKSKDPLEDPEIDPHSFEIPLGECFCSPIPRLQTDYGPIDLELLVEHIKFIRRLAQAEPLKSGVVREVDPGPNVTSDEDLAGMASSSSSAHKIYTDRD